MSSRANSEHEVTTNGDHLTTKAEIEHRSIEKERTSDPTYDQEDLTLSKQEEKRLLRKIDWAIIPYCSLLYLLSFLDRVNIGQAAIAGLKADLGISTGNGYQIALSVFFIGYIAFEVPSNLALKALKPHRWIPLIMITWSITMTLMGLVRSLGGLEVARFFLGVAEGGLFPGINFLLTCWYPRRDQNLRIGIFFSGATLAGAFGGILAYGLKQIPFPDHDGWGNTHVVGNAKAGGWRWIFIFEGLLTFVCALPAWWLIVDFPSGDNKLLTPSETAKWNNHLARSQGVTNADTAFSWKQVASAFKDYKTYLYAIMYLSIAEPLYALALFTPTIIADLDFTNASANLMSVPPYVLGFVTTLITAFVSDRYLFRGPFIMFWGLITIIGYIILICDVAPGVKYFALFLTVSGVSPNIATAISWVGGNFGPVYKRAAVMGFFFTIGNGAGLISSNIYPSTEAPRYIKGHAINLGFACLTLVITALIMWINMNENKKRDQISVANIDGSDVDPEKLDSEEEKKRWGYEGMTKEDLLLLGDRHRAFRYTY